MRKREDAHERERKDEASRAKVEAGDMRKILEERGERIKVL